MFTLGIDIGGTFTDLVLLELSTNKLYFGKTLTTYPDPTHGILNGVNELLLTCDKNIKGVTTLVHGTTLVTNAVIERKGAVTGLLTTAGFEDVLEIGREMRYDIYDLFITMPKPLVPASLRMGVVERMSNTGKVITKLNINEVEKTINKLLKKGVQSIAVSLLHSYANTQHEQQIGKLLATKYKHITYSLSSEVMPEIREYERTSATVMNAYVQPLTNHYLKNLNSNLQQLGFAGHLLIMDSAGRLTTVDGARKKPVQLLESGPAGGTMAGVFFGGLMGKPNLVAFDMGGTTAKASMIRNLQPEITNHFEAAREKRFKKGSGLPVRIPVIDMIEIGAGGGSIAHINNLGLLTVGPESASSSPGPACYNLGGVNPTVTDADLILGFINPNYFLGGTMQLNMEAARKAMDIKIAKPLGITIEAAAWGIHRIVNENMANAARVHIIEKGLDPRFFSMLAFGGAGPVHAFNVAKLMGTPQLIIPSGAGVLSALGFLVSPVASEVITSYMVQLQHISIASLNALLIKMRSKGNSFLKQSGIDVSTATVRVVADMRYLGQGHEIMVHIPSEVITPELIPVIQTNFETEYKLRYGRDMDNIPIEAVTWRVLVSAPSPKFVPIYHSTTIPGAKAKKGERQVYWGKDYISTPVYDRYAIPTHKKLKGPCIIEEVESTTVIGADSTVSIDEHKNIVIDLN